MKTYLLLLAIFVWLLSCGDEGGATNDQNNDDTGAGYNVDCTSLSIDECEKHNNCFLVKGDKYDMGNECAIGRNLPAWCLGGGETCSDLVATAWDPAGYCWLLPCIYNLPEDWSYEGNECTTLMSKDNIPSCEE